MKKLYTMLMLAVLFIGIAQRTFAECPKNEAAALADDPSRSCRRECTVDADCTGTKTCNCDDLCGRSCFNSDADCDPLTLTDGTISYSDGQNYNSEATHTCNSGFYLSGQKIRKCRSTRAWSHSTDIPNCTQGCPTPAVSLGNSFLLEGEIAGASAYPVGHIITYQCRTGYLPSGSDFTRTCQSVYSWTNAQFTCTIVSCGAPQSISHGSHSGTNYDFGGTVVYSCGTGYNLNGQAAFQCRTEGMWVPENSWPTCERISQPTSQNCSARDEAAAQAEDPSRNCRTECTDDTTCTGVKTCNCDDLCGMSCFNPEGCPTPTASFGNSFLLEGEILGASAYPIGHVITYQCNTGYLPSGDMTRTCHSDYTWTNAQFTCTIVSCGAPQSISHGSHSGTNYDFGGTVVYSCDTGYNLNGQAAFQCRSSGRWEPENSWPTCEPVLCLPPAAPNNGYVVASAPYEFGNIATYSCHPGHILNGPTTGTCDENGSWGTVPICDVTLDADFDDDFDGYTGSWTRTSANPGSDGLPTIVLAVAGDGTVRSLAYPLTGDEKVCMEAAVRRIGANELKAEAYNGTTKLLHTFTATGDTWITEKFWLEPVVSTDTTVQLQFVSTNANAQLDNIKQLDASACAGIPRPSPETTTPTSPTTAPSTAPSTEPTTTTPDDETTMTVTTTTAVETTTPTTTTAPSAAPSTTTTSLAPSTEPTTTPDDERTTPTSPTTAPSSAPSTEPTTTTPDDETTMTVTTATASWKPWGVWSECSSSCSPGLQVRKRLSVIDRSEGNETKPCNTELCDNYSKDKITCIGTGDIPPACKLDAFVQSQLNKDFLSGSTEDIKQSADGKLKVKITKFKIPEMNIKFVKISGERKNGN